MREKKDLQQGVLGGNMDPRAGARAMADKDKEISAMYKNRKEELAAQQAHIRQQFAKNIEDLYRKAVALHNQGYFSQSTTMFSEINRLYPGYKQTSQYLSGMQGNISSSMMPQSYTYARPSEPEPKSRMHAITDALNRFESKLW